MKKVMNIVIGGIENKIFNVFLVTIILVVGSFLAVIGVQSSRLRRVAAEANEKQMQAITETASMTMRSVINDTLGNDVQLKAVAADDVFRELRRQVEMTAQYAQVLYSSPEKYDRIEVRAPDAGNDGMPSAQLLSEEGVDLSDPEIVSEISLLGNMAETLKNFYSNSRINSCFIASANGFCILADERSASKTGENGKVMHFPVRQRPWYKGAAESDGIYFSDVERDMFTDKIGIVCAIPVYVDGKLVAVAGADLFLEELEEAIENSSQEGRFIAVINQEGHVIFSPQKEGIFQVRTADSAEDLRNTDNKELSSFIREALSKSTEVETVTVDGKEYYMAGASLDTVGWALVSVVDRELTEIPQKTMEEGLENISAEATATYRKSVSNATRTLVILLLILFALGAVSVSILGKRIVRPLAIMTHKISSLSGTNPLFTMEDTFRTGDEVQVLAESFANLSRRTVSYVEEITKITAEKERIGTELGMATSIQASQLPSIFPPFPDRREFEIFASMDPAKEVGGDFYDFFLVDDQHMAMVMADVSGKGVPAALFMMIAKILIKNRVLSGDSPAVVLSKVNNQLLEGNDAKMFVTVWLGIIDLATGKGVAANAGHEHPAVCRKGGQYELVKYRHSPAVGVVERVRFKEHEFELNPGDTLFVYTDGVPEAENAAQELFGTDRMLQALNKDPAASPKKVLGNVMDGISAFVKDATQFDDITMLCMKYIGRPGSEEYHMKELVLEARKENLGKVLAFVDEQMEESGCSMKDQMQVDLAVEELFINVASYAYAPGTGDAAIRVETKDDPRRIAITLSDRGMPYNPLEKEDPDVTLSAEERNIGGLGIFMVKKSVDDIHYEYKYGQNIITIEKNL